MANDLDSAVDAALQALDSPESGDFDVERYAKAFHASAEAKARKVLELLGNSPFKDLRPVLVSIGGADGQELIELLQESRGTLGVLVESHRTLAQEARSRSKPEGTRIEVFEGDASVKLKEAVEFAHRAVREGDGDFVAISCHAVIHELFDRSQGEFDRLGFFGTLFSDQRIPTWFTYREPGLPEKWPETVLLKAACSPSLLERLAKEIRKRHDAFRNAEQWPPQIVGDDVRLGRALAMEVITKLFYLSDLRHEIEERSTAIHHRELVSFLLLAIGETATRQQRAEIKLTSAPSASFEKHWREKAIEVRGLSPDGSTSLLATPESHSRVVAWRQGDSIGVVDDLSGDARLELAQPKQGAADLRLADEARRVGDEQLLRAILVSRGRGWIERSDKEQALELLEAVKRESEDGSFLFLWCHFLTALARLFSGAGFSSEDFSEDKERAAGGVGLGLLFRAERMEFARKSGRHDVALEVGNSLLSATLDQPKDALERYVTGTVHFLLSNLFRAGGLYDEALGRLKAAESLLVPGIESHDNELVHYSYARAVCHSMRGYATLQPPTEGSSQATYIFADALIQLSYATAAWFVDDLGRAIDFAQRARDAFGRIGSVGYVTRAENLRRLFAAWRTLTEGGQGQGLELGEEHQVGLAYIIGLSEDETGFRQWFQELRPSVAVGLLQFRRFVLKERALPDLKVPRTLELLENGSLSWREEMAVGSLSDADAVLREAVGAPPDVRLPLIPD